MMMTSGPQQFRPTNCILSDADTARINRFIVRIGGIRAASRILGVGPATFDAARGFGRLQMKTRDRLLAALADEEAAR